MSKRDDLKYSERHSKGSQLRAKDRRAELDEDEHRSAASPRHPRQSSPSRIHGCNENCISVLGEKHSPKAPTPSKRHVCFCECHPWDGNQNMQLAAELDRYLENL